jgi:glucokinase
MEAWPYPTLLADIGGTHVRFALADRPGGEPACIDVLDTAEHPDLATAAESYLAEVGRERRAPPASAALAIAAPAAEARRGPVRLTNSAFVIDAAALGPRLGLSALWVVNDFEALAWAVPTLEAADLDRIGPVAPSMDANVAVIGPGTGMGCAGMVRNRTGWHAVAGEGGHVTLAARTALEREVLAAAAVRADHVSAERLLSGTGLPLLYHAVAMVRGDEAAKRPAPAPATITSSANAGTDALSVEVMSLFCSLLGGFAGNVALTFGATGGVVIGGGILTHVRDFLERSEFRRRFEDKGRFAGYLERIGTALITREQPALGGLVYALQHSLASLPVQRT